MAIDGLRWLPTAIETLAVSNARPNPPVRASPPLGVGLHGAAASSRAVFPFCQALANLPAARFKHFANVWQNATRFAEHWQNSGVRHPAAHFSKTTARQDLKETLFTEHHPDKTALCRRNNHGKGIVQRMEDDGGDKPTDMGDESGFRSVALCGRKGPCRTRSRQHAPEPMQERAPAPTPNKCSR